MHYCHIVNTVSIQVECYNGIPTNSVLTTANMLCFEHKLAWTSKLSYQNLASNPGLPYRFFATAVKKSAWKAWV